MYIYIYIYHYGVNGIIVKYHSRKTSKMESLGSKTNHHGNIWATVDDCEILHQLAKICKSHYNLIISSAS